MIHLRKVSLLSILRIDPILAIGVGSGGAPQTYTFDGVGNNTVEQTNTRLTTNTWDPESRLTGIVWKQKSSSGLSTYTFSGDGLRRSAQEQGGALATMVWDGSDHIQERT